MSLKHFNKTQALFGFNKERIVFFISLIMMIISSSISVYAANYLYSSSEVSFDNSSSGISSDNVQGAIDELYQNASDYSSLDSRIGVLEGRWKNSPESYFEKSGGQEWLSIKNSASGNRGVALFDSSGNVRTYFNYVPTNDFTQLSAADSSGAGGTGKLNLRGNPVMVNGTSISPTAISLTANKGTILTNKSFYIGNAVFLNFKLSGITISAKTITVVATIPAGYRSSQETQIFMGDNTNDENVALRSWIRTNGEIVAYSNKALNNAELYAVSNYLK